jgi:peroxiredoxin
MQNPILASARKYLASMIAAVLLCLGSALAVGTVGDMAGDFSGLTDLNGAAHGLKDYKGKVVLLMTVQWNCGGCNANAPRVGSIAWKFHGKAFQAIGPDINNGTVAQLKTFEKNLKLNADSVDFPLLRGIPAAQIQSTNLGTKWSSYDALRDVYFVIDHTGKIVQRVDGDRSNATTEANYKKVEDAITTALANIPTVSIGAISGNHDLCLRACKRAGVYQINVDPQGKVLFGNVSMRILDPQGRLVRNLDETGGSGSAQSGAGANLIWDGRDYQGKSVAWGCYFLNATAPGSSVTLLLSWLP